MPLRLSSLTQPGDIAALNRWADYIETKLRGAINDTSFVNALGERAISAAANATGASFKGTWSSTVTYTTGAQVNYNGNTWGALQNSTNQAPATGPYWQLIGPSTLDNVADGASFARLKIAQLTSNTLGANSSYRPTSNPLTATDAGSSATVSIAAWTNQVSGIGPISYNGGSITGLAYGTLYYIYVTDPTLSGGAVSYNYTTTKSDIVSGIGNFYVGSILTPLSGGANTAGNNDGGAGAQSGASGNLFASVIAVVNTGGTATIVNQGRMVDGNLNDYGEIQLSGTMSGSLTLSGISGIAPAYSSLTLNIKTGIPTNGGALLTLAYSLDGGSTWTQVYSTGSPLSPTTSSITLNQSQNLGAVQVRCTWSSSVGAHWDIYGAYISAVS